MAVTWWVFNVCISSYYFESRLKVSELGEFIIVSEITTLSHLQLNPLSSRAMWWEPDNTLPVPGSVLQERSPGNMNLAHYIYFAFFTPWKKKSLISLRYTHSLEEQRGKDFRFLPFRMQINVSRGKIRQVCRFTILEFLGGGDKFYYLLNRSRWL